MRVVYAECMNIFIATSQFSDAAITVQWGNAKQYNASKNRPEQYCRHYTTWEVCTKEVIKRELSLHSILPLHIEGIRDTVLLPDVFISDLCKQIQSALLAYFVYNHMTHILGKKKMLRCGKS